ncbi:hypothetical protein A1353_10795 [Methylomonas methanica]|uniref:Radical SAM core domain-containing protein n=1 Tax=Methylomonas methanica TaxID=421 RepID=A0A177MJR0_METMH|nr:radical SAM protein [Methylomonas methanica]OAI05654.1 hypothetical protein A1353_10795 [Methylomonas methanica]
MHFLKESQSVDGAKPLRAVLNFAHKCAMKCDWCYVPFGTPLATASVVESIVNRLAFLGFKWLTIGGGDPFQYSFIPNIIRLAKSQGLFVQVDTHGKSLYQSQSNLELLTDAVDLLGLPLDGSESSVHDQMRGSGGHFNLVCRRIEWLNSFRSRLKINTIVSSRNSHDLIHVAKLVSSFSPARWSVYQYWPLGPAARVFSDHAVSDSEFAACVEEAKSVIVNGGPILEINPRESRRDTYPIIHHDGEVFVHAIAPHDEFISLGSIFAPNVLASIYSSCIAERSQAKNRYPF